MQGAWVRNLAKDLRSHMQQCTTKKEIKRFQAKETAREMPRDGNNQLRRNRMNVDMIRVEGEGREGRTELWVETESSHAEQEKPC